jgi:hypothetical protein
MYRVVGAACSWRMSVAPGKCIAAHAVLQDEAAACVAEFPMNAVLRDVLPGGTLCILERLLGYLCCKAVIGAKSFLSYQLGVRG